MTAVPREVAHKQAANAPSQPRSTQVDGRVVDGQFRENRPVMTWSAAGLWVSALGALLFVGFLLSLIKH